MEKNKELEQERIDQFIRWYKEEAYSFSTTQIGQFFPDINMEDLINKIATWYELKYSSDNIDDKSNPNEEIFTKERLIEVLPWYQRMYLHKTRYVNIIKVLNGENHTNMHIQPDGHVENSIENRRLPVEWLGMHIKDLLTNLSGNDNDPNVLELRKAIKNYEVQEEIKRRLCESVIYRLIMNKSDDKGLKRAVYFVKEFRLDPSIVLDAAMARNDKEVLKEILKYIDEENNLQNGLKQGIKL